MTQLLGAPPHIGMEYEKNSRANENMQILQWLGHGQDKSKLKSDA